MSGFEERVVDQWVDGAWMDFRLRLAEWLTDAEDAVLHLDPGVDDPEAPTLRVSVNRTTLYLELLAAGAEPGFGSVVLPPQYRLDRHGVRQLDHLGFLIDPTGEPCLAVGRREVDRLAHAVAFVLHDLWGVVSPAFLDVETQGEFEAHLLPASQDDPQQPPSAVVPRVARTATVEELQRLVEAVMQEEVEAPLKVSSDGSIRMRGVGGPVVVRVRGHHLVEVVTVLATRVRFKKAHREIDRLSRRHRHVRFFLQRDTLFAVIGVDASPLVAEHLHAAVSRLLFLRTRVVDLDEGLKKRRLPETLSEADHVPDPLLSVIAADAGRMEAEALAEVLRVTLTDEKQSAAWRAEARRACSRALAATRAAEGPMQRVHLNDWRRWRKVVTAIEVGRGEVPAAIDEDTP